MSWCVEYWKVERKSSGSHAQMREQLTWVEPDPKDISRRYFSDYKSAKRFASSIFDRGNYHTHLKKE